MTQITAKPFIARPLTARPFTAYPFGESTSVSNPLVWHAATPDSDGVMQAQLIGSGTPTFNVDAGLLLPDHEGIYRTTAEDTAPWHGARKVVNLLRYSEDLVAGAWVATNATIDSATAATFTSDYGHVRTPFLTSFFSGGSTIVFSVYLSGSGTLGFQIDSNTPSSSQMVTLTSEVKRYSIIYEIPTSGYTYVAARIEKNNGTATGFTFHGAQVENVTGQANQNPSEYVPTDIAKAGASELVTNGGFDADSGWTKGTGITISSGKAVFASVAVGQDLKQDGVFPGSGSKRYIITLEVSNYTAGDISVLGWGTTVPLAISGNGVYTKIATYSGSDDRLILRSNATATFSIDNISVKEATPGYEYYGTENGNTVSSNVVSSAQGATLDPLPSLYSAPSYTNSLTFSNDLTNAAWTAFQATAAKDETGLTGEPNTASTITDNAASFNGTLYRTVTIPADTNYNTLRYFIKKDTDETRFPGVSITHTSAATADIWGLNTKTGYTWVLSSASSWTGLIEVNDAGDWWEVLVSAQNDSRTSIISGVYAALAKTEDGAIDATTQGSCIVGNAELFLNKTIAQVRGSAPIITGASAVTTSAVSIAYDIANHSDVQGAYYCEATPLHDYATNTFSIVSLRASTTNLIYQNGAYLKSYDGTTANQFVNNAYSAGDIIKAGVAYGGSDSGLLVGAGSWVEGSYDGSYNGTATYFAYNSSYPVLIRNVRRYNLNYTASKAKIEELMA